MLVRAGENKTRTSREGLNLEQLSTASDWEFSVDLGNKLKLPTEMVTTTLRPDAILFSKEKKQISILELTIPWETRIDPAHCKKWTVTRPIRV